MPCNGLAGRVLAEEPAGLGEESDDDDVAEKKNEERARDDAGKLPEVFSGDSNGERDPSEGPRDEDHSKTQLRVPKELRDVKHCARSLTFVLGLVTPTGFLSFQSVKIEQTHQTQRERERSKAMGEAERVLLCYGIGCRSGKCFPEK